MCEYAQNRIFSINIKNALHIVYTVLKYKNERLIELIFKKLSRVLHD